MKGFSAIAAALLVATPIAAQQVLNLRDADIRAFIQDVARVTGRNFIIDPRVTGKVSVVTDRALSRSEYFELFLSTLRANNLVAVPMTGGALRIQPTEGAATLPSRIGSAGASSDAFITDVIRLRSIDATAALDTLRPLVSPQGSVTANRSANSLIIADYADNVRRMRGLVRQIDQDNAATRMIPLKNAGAREIAYALSTLTNTGAGAAGAGGAMGNVTVVAVDSGNALLLRGDSVSVARLAELAQELDRRAASASEIRVIFLRYADAAQLLPVLQQLIGQAADVIPAASSHGGNAATGGSGTTAPAPPPVSGNSAPRAKGEPVVTRFEGANAIIISGPADIQRTLGEVVRQLDTRRDQVLVEAIIVEISNDAARKLGVQFLLAGKPGTGIPFAATNYSNADPNILTIGGAIEARKLATTTTTVNGTTTTTSTDNAVSDQLAQAAVSSILSAGGGFAGFANMIGKNAVFGAIINAVQSDTKSNILSTPSVLTLDNQEAKLLVGQEVPVTTGQALSNNFDNQFRTVQRQNVGVQLEVKPQINSGGAIKLYLRQEVSSIAGPVATGSPDLIFNKRQIETTVTVDDGEIIALGGLLDDNERRTIERIPLLSDIPGIGELFKSRSRTHTKTNLMVFIRPTILRSKADAEQLAAQRYGYIRAEQARYDPKSEPGIDELIHDYMGTTPPTLQPSAALSHPAGPPEIIVPTMTTTTEIGRPIESLPPKKRK
jgi:general secretion pathway protein D